MYIRTLNAAPPDPLHTHHKQALSFSDFPKVGAVTPQALHFHLPSILPLFSVPVISC